MQDGIDELRAAVSSAKGKAATNLTKALAVIDQLLAERDAAVASASTVAPVADPVTPAADSPAHGGESELQALRDALAKAKEEEKRTMTRSIERIKAFEKELDVVKASKIALQAEFDQASASWKALEGQLLSEQMSRQTDHVLELKALQEALSRAKEHANMNAANDLIRIRELEEALCAQTEALSALRGCCHHAQEVATLLADLASERTAKDTAELELRNLRKQLSTAGEGGAAAGEGGRRRAELPAQLLGHVMKHMKALLGEAWL